VPSQSKIAGGKETFTVTLSYDTRDLWGKIVASYKITVAAN
jgi:hypothetical protein